MMAFITLFNFMILLIQDEGPFKKQTGRMGDLLIYFLSHNR